jgi:hypothetical protein
MSLKDLLEQVGPIEVAKIARMVERRSSCGREVRDLLGCDDGLFDAIAAYLKSSPSGFSATIRLPRHKKIRAYYAYGRRRFGVGVFGGEYDSLVDALLAAEKR